MFLHQVITSCDKLSKYSEHRETACAEISDAVVKRRIGYCERQEVEAELKRNGQVRHKLN